MKNLYRQKKKKQNKNTQLQTEFSVKATRMVSDLLMISCW